MRRWRIFIGYDTREDEAYRVACYSAQKHSNWRVPVTPLVLSDLQRRKLYTRPTQERLLPQGGYQLWDEISDKPMATEFALSRFLVPHLSGFDGFALFQDVDVLTRHNLEPLFRMAEARPEIALWCVKHDHRPTNSEKMDGQQQTSYRCKNWSSVMLFNCGHLAHHRLTVPFVNDRTGLDLHQFVWLPEAVIGELEPKWNYLVGHMPPGIDPAIVHFTDGGPWLPEFAQVPYAEEWFAIRKDQMASACD